jgi:hypothetical protein
LREAVAEASTTAGVYTALMFSGVSSITVSTPITLSGQSIIVLGPGASAPNSAGVGAPSESSGVTISGGGVSQIFGVNQGSSLFIDGVTLSGGVAPAEGSGGAVENNGSLAIVNTIFSGNGGSSTIYGGAVYDEGAVPSTIAASTFTNNTALYQGGAYYNDAGASFSRTLFTGNAAFSSGGCNCSGGAIYAYWNLNVDSSTFTANVAGSQTASGFTGSGGAIAIFYDSLSPSITNSTFGGSTASAGNFAGGAGSNDDGIGGAIYNGGPSTQPMTFSGNTFSHNIAKGGDEASGGAIWDDRGITSTTDTFTNNVADGTAATNSSDAYGGAVYDSGAISFTSDMFSGNQALGGTSPYAGSSAGAIYSDGALSATQTTFSNNSVAAADDAYGGAVYDDDPSDTVVFSSVQFTANSATASIPGNPQDSPEAEGGGLEIDYAPISWSNVTISGNTATATGNATYPGNALGGGFEYYSGDSQNQGCGDCCDEQCSKARNANATVQRALPPAAKAHAARLARRVARFASMKAHRASTLARMQALALARTPKNTKHAWAAAQQAAVRKPQGASGPPNGLDTVTFMNNTANAGAGGYAYGGGAEFSGYPTTNAVAFTGNIAEASGTGGYAVGGGFTYGNEDSCDTLTFTGTISGNSATNAGGGIWNVCGEVDIESSTVSGNSVTAVAYINDGGGGLWNYDTMTVVQSLVSGNSVAGAVAGTGGGGILTYSNYTNVVNSTIFNNTSSVDGGGIENAGNGELDLTNATITQNMATGHGGNVNNDPADQAPGSTFVYIANTILAGGTAASGSDVWNLDQFISSGYNIVQQSTNFGSGTANTPQTGDLIGTNPLISMALAANGGPTQTLSDTASSPGTGHIPFASGECNGQNGTNVDQRGYTRGAGSVCDVGAYEFSGASSGTQSVRRAAPRVTRFIRAGK